VHPQQDPAYEGKLILRFEDPPVGAEIEVTLANGRTWLFTRFPAQLSMPLHERIMIRASAPPGGFSKSSRDVRLSADAPSLDVTMSVPHPRYAGPWGFPESELPKELGLIRATTCAGEPAAPVFEMAEWRGRSSMFVDEKRRLWRELYTRNLHIRWLVGSIAPPMFDAMTGLIAAAKLGEKQPVPGFWCCGNHEMWAYVSGEKVFLASDGEFPRSRLDSPAAEVIIRWMSALALRSGLGAECFEKRLQPPESPPGRHGRRRLPGQDQLR
jgi:hypothetical protein